MSAFNEAVGMSLPGSASAPAMQDAVGRDIAVSRAAGPPKTLSEIKIKQCADHVDALFAMMRSGESNVPPLLRNLVILPPSSIDFTPYENVSSPAYGDETMKLISSAQGLRPIRPFIGLFACGL